MVSVSALVSNGCSTWTNQSFWLLLWTEWFVLDMSRQMTLQISVFCGVCCEDRAPQNPENKTKIGFWFLFLYTVIVVVKVVFWEICRNYSFSKLKSKKSLKKWGRRHTVFDATFNSAMFDLTRYHWNSRWKHFPLQLVTCDLVLVLVV
jgi:hypothetical protein